jgi:general stress protein 26
MPQTPDAIARLNELLKGIGTAVLTTVRSDGTLHSCPMVARAVTADGVLWFLSHNHTEKVEAVRNHQQVNLAFTDPASQRYVSISGYCELVRDHAIAKDLWDPSYASWLPGGPEDADLILMKVDIQHAECWDAVQGRMMTVVSVAQS